MGITGANAIAAREGAILILHNEGNITRVRTRSKYIIISSIDKVYPNVQDALLMAGLETFLATGSFFPSFVDIVGGRSKSSDVEKIPFFGMHEPTELVIILLDNGRREICEERKEFSDLLYCIGCGNCLLGCPAYNSVGSYFGADGMLGGRGVSLAALQKGMKEGMEDGLFLCTTCGLCGEVCPVGIDAGKRIKELRKWCFLDPETSAQIDEVTLLQTTMDQYGTPYGTMARADFSFVKKKSPLVLYVGCVGMSTETETATHAIQLLEKMGIGFTLIDEVCCEAVKGETGSRPNSARVKQNIEKIKEAGGREVLFLCPTCLKTFLEHDANEPTGLIFQAMTGFLKKNFSFSASHADLETRTYHDPCHLGRGLGSYDEGRDLLKIFGEFVEMEHHHRESLCCGAGGGVRAFYPKFSRDMARKRVKEAEEVKAEILLTDCLSCKHNLKQGISSESGKIRVMITPEYLLEKIEAGKLRFSPQKGST
jgi:Fe-S oxidoreductase